VVPSTLPSRTPPIAGWVFAANAIQNVEVAVLLLRRRRDAREHFVLDDWEIVGAAEIHPIALTGLQVHEARARALGLARDDAHGAAERVLAEQRALRAAQHLDALYVEQIHDGTLRAPVIHVIDINRHTGLERQRVVAQADAANERCGGRSPTGAQRCDDGIRHEGVEIERARRPARLEAFAREGCDRERCLLQVFLAKTSRHDDLFERFLCERVRGQR
jgi:hypothetical protein